MRHALANRIVEGRILELLTCYMKSGLTVYEITEALNKEKFFRGTARAWFKAGFSRCEVAGFLMRLKRAGLVKRKPNGNRYGIWRLNGGVKPLQNAHLAKRRKRSYWGKPRLFRLWHQRTW